MIWAINEEGMRVRADDYELRYNYFLQKKCGELLPKLYAPCCHSPVILVQSQMNVHPHFRHPKFAKCEYAQNYEYLESLHWEIADYLEELSSNAKIWSRFLKKVRTISFFKKFNLKKHFLFYREKIISRKGKIKRADIIVNNLIVEIQCSNISIEEIDTRNRYYRHHPFYIKWILGFTAHKPHLVHIEFPIYANDFIKKRFQEQVHRYRKYKQNRSNKDFFLNVFVLNRWQTHLIKKKHVIALYYNGFFYPNFTYGQIYTSVNPLEFKGACRIIRFVTLEEKTKF